MKYRQKIGELRDLQIDEHAIEELKKQRRFKSAKINESFLTADSFVGEVDNFTQELNHLDIFDYSNEYERLLKIVSFMCYWNSYMHYSFIITIYYLLKEASKTIIMELTSIIQKYTKQVKDLTKSLAQNPKDTIKSGELETFKLKKLIIQFIFDSPILPVMPLRSDLNDEFENIISYQEMQKESMMFNTNNQENNFSTL